MATKRQFNLDSVIGDAKATIDSAKQGNSKKELEKKPDRDSKNQDMKKNIRNAFLSDESLFRLNLVRKEMNGNRSEGDSNISLATLMGKIIEEYLDKNYPQTKDLYQKIYGNN